MGFWIFMTLCNLMIPTLMIVIGVIFKKHPPKTINGIYGYRTTMSMKNMDTWNFAHLYCGKLWWKIGWCMLPVSVLLMMPVLGKSTDTMGTWGGIIEAVQCFFLFITIFLVERALGRTFDKNGQRK